MPRITAACARAFWPGLRTRLPNHIQRRCRTATFASGVATASNAASRTITSASLRTSPGCRRLDSMTTAFRRCARSPLPGRSQKPPKMQQSTFDKLRRQARLQEEQRTAIARGDAQPYRYEFLESGIRANGIADDDAQRGSARGFYRLPEPSPGDVFFDMEGDPYYDIGTGLEYLFGAYTPEGAFYAHWGCDRGAIPVSDRLAEKRAFEAFIDLVMERRERYPGMHVYHYASYEKTALQKLSLRHATREDEVDILLREERLVDLYAIVRQAIVVGQPSYSIKKIEEFYGKRGAESQVTAGADSILRFEEWLARRADVTRRDDRSWTTSSATTSTIASRPTVCANGSCNCALRRHNSLPSISRRSAAPKLKRQRLKRSIPN